jgi:hypothetical protein
MNTEQLWLSLRVICSAGGPVAALLIARGMPKEDVTLWSDLALAILGIAPTIVSLFVGLRNRTDAAKIVAAENVPGVVEIKVDPRSVPAAIADAANDLNREKITPSP